MSSRTTGKPRSVRTTGIHSTSDIPLNGHLVRRRPFRAPHHTASTAALVGGGSGRARPGEITLAHRGILFLDELGEFAPTALDALRQPLEERAVRISRQGVSLTFPAAFQLVACSNPCPCGSAGNECRCTDVQRERYRRRLSAPLLDRFDLRVRVDAPESILPFLSVEELYDHLVKRLGFDSEGPGWSPALRDLHKRSRDRRLQLIPEFFYTPVVSPAHVPESQWKGRFDACGEWSVEKQRAFLRETPPFADFLGTLPWDPPEDPTVFHWNNDQFSHSDAALYYTLLRRFRPRRVVEVGAGHSTKLAAVRIDPDNLEMIDSPLHHAYRIDGQGAASLRAGARIGSWVQTLMQLVGP